MKNKLDVQLDVNNDVIYIKIPGTNKFAFVDYSTEMYDLISKARFRIPSNEKAAQEYKYPYSNEFQKTLHQISFDYHFGQEFREKAYANGYIIEHLDNNGFNCLISNLFILKQIKNTYKGWHYDKLVGENRHIASLNIFHILDNKTFQINIVFNQTLHNQKLNKTLEKLSLLYSYDYEIVLQDAENIIESLSNGKPINFNDWKTIYRFKDIRIIYSDKIQLTDEEKTLPFGSIITRDKGSYLLVGSNEESMALVNSTPYYKDWDIE